MSEFVDGTLPIEDKVDHPQRVKDLEGILSKYFYSSSDFNLLKRAIIENFTDKLAKGNFEGTADDLKDQLDNVVFEGAKTYNTLQLAKDYYASADPKPVNGTGFKVSKVTDAANAGNYTFQSGEANGVRPEGGIPLTEDDKSTTGVAAGESRLVTSEEVFNFRKTTYPFAEGQISPIVGSNIVIFDQINEAQVLYNSTKHTSEGYLKNYAVSAIGKDGSNNLFVTLTGSRNGLTAGGTITMSKPLASVTNIKSVDFQYINDSVNVIMNIDFTLLQAGSYNWINFHNVSRFSNKVILDNESGLIKLANIAYEAKYFQPLVNFMQYTEDITNATWFLTDFATISTGNTQGVDFLNFNKVKLRKVTFNSFNGYIKTRLTAVPLPDLEVGQMYCASCFVLSQKKQEDFIYMRPLANTSSPGHGPKLIDGNVRRIKQYFIASSVDRIDPLGVPANGYATSGGSQDLYWFFAGNRDAQYGSNNLTVFIGGFQIEKTLPEAAKQNAIAMGDSITQAGEANYDNGTNRAWTDFVAGMLGINVFNRAVGGETSAQMDARWATDITPLAAVSKWVFINAGVNDLSIDRSLGDIQASITSMFNKAVADNLIPIICTCTPANFSGTREANRLLLNEWILNTYPLTQDWADILADPNNKSVLNPNWVGDNVHPTYQGYRHLGNAIAQWKFWDLIKINPYNQKLTTSLTKELPFERKIGEIDDIIPIDVFSESNRSNLGNRWPRD